MDKNLKCYHFQKIIYQNSLFNEICATYIIHLVGNNRYDDIMTQLEIYHPTKILYILHNKGFKKCEKTKNIKLSGHDLVDAFLQIFIHAKKNNYNNILILEDDFIFNKYIDNKTTNNITNFLNNNKNKDFQYLLGCMPLIKMPYSLDLNHFISIISLGTHACIYSKKNRERILNLDSYNIKDWDIYNFLNSRRYVYYRPLCYQLFPITENSQNWGKDNYIIYLLSKVTRSIFNLYKLDKQIEPGYTFFYFFSKIFFFLILFLIFIIIYIILKKYNK